MKILSAPLGIAIVLLNTTVGIWANYFAGGASGMSNMLIIVGLLMIFDWKNLASFRFPAWNKYFSMMMVFQAICLLYYIHSDSGIRFLYFHLSFIVFMLALATRTQVNEKATIYFLFGNSFITTLCGIWAIYSGQMARAYIQGNEFTNSATDHQLEVLELFTVGASGTYCFMSSMLMFKDKSKIANILAVLGISLGLFLTILCTKRNPFVKCFFAVILFIYNQYSVKKLFSIRNVFLFVLLVCSVLFLINLTGIGVSALSSMTDNLFSGLNDMITGDETDSSGSAYLRAIQRQQGLDHIMKMPFEECILGSGYMWKWLDVPLVQIFCDMGILGFCFWVYLLIINPAKAMLCSKQSSLIVLTGLLFSLHITQCMSSGHPYMFAYYFGPIFLMYALTINSVNR